MKLAHIVGARPQLIKLAAVSRAVAEHNKQVTHGGHIEELIIHTGQHYDYGMSAVFFEELGIPEPDWNLGVGSGGQGEQTGEMLERIEPILLEQRPDLVLVYGDTNSTLAGALAAAKLSLPVAHVEAGLRSFNRRMPEEINRVLTDHLSTILFCPTELAVKNLRKEGFANIAYEGRLSPLEGLEVTCSAEDPLVVNVGDVMFDSILHHLKLGEGRSEILQRLGLEAGGYYLATVHRAENTNEPRRLAEIFSAFAELAAGGREVVCPLHPRTRKALAELALGGWPPKLRLIEPVSYLEMLLLEENAPMILTDSGGVQKEAFILRKPCVTLRGETEWAETVEAGWNTLAGADRGAILRAVERFERRRPGEPEVHPYGDGRAGARIAKLIAASLS